MAHQEQPDDIVPIKHFCVDSVHSIIHLFVNAAASDKKETWALLAAMICRTANDCSKGNLETCKVLIVKELLPSSLGIHSLYDLLHCLSTHFKPEPAGSSAVHRDYSDLEWAGLGFDSNGQRKQPPLNTTRRANLVKILNEVLIYASLLDNAAFSKDHPKKEAIGVLQLSLTWLFELAACRLDPTEAQHSAADLASLHELWTDQKTYPEAFDHNFQVGVNSAFEKMYRTKHMDAVIALRYTRPGYDHGNDRKYWLPESHFRISAPSRARDLPINKFILSRTRGYPLRLDAIPERGFPIPGGGVWIDRTSKVVRDKERLHQEMLDIFDEAENGIDASKVEDIDELGNIVWKDPERPTRNYYGFSHEGLQKVRARWEEDQKHLIGYDDLPPPTPPVDRFDLPTDYTKDNWRAVDIIKAEREEIRELQEAHWDEILIEESRARLAERFAEEARWSGGRGGGRGGFRGGHGNRGRGPRSG